MDKNETLATIKKDVNFASFFMDLYYDWKWNKEELKDRQEWLEKFQQKIPNAYKMTLKPFGFYIKCLDGEVLIALYKKGNKMECRIKGFKGKEV